jgi:hypothetical protein
VSLVLLVWIVPPAVILTILIGREWRRLRREREALRKEAEATAAEGFPPPGPPTT